MPHPCGQRFFIPTFGCQPKLDGWLCKQQTLLRAMFIGLIFCKNAVGALSYAVGYAFIP